VSITVRSLARSPRLCSRRRFSAALIPLAIVTVFTTGCRSGGDKRYDLLEAELRTRERELADAQAELNSIRAIRQMQLPVCPPDGVTVGRGPMARDISLGIGTGGYDADGKPGDEGLQVILVPKDDDGSAMKIPGRLVVAAYGVARDGTKTPVGLWEIPPDKLRVYWQTGLLSTGYKLALQWHQAPATEKVRVVVQLTTLDGKTYETDKDITVRLMTLPGNVPNPTIPELPSPSGMNVIPPATGSAPEYDPFPGNGARLKPARSS
jgi:hypothetical protein